jgi:CHAP domain
LRSICAAIFVLSIPAFAGCAGSSGVDSKDDSQNKSDLIPSDPSYSEGSCVAPDGRNYNYGDYCGSDYVNGDPGTLYFCDGAGNISVAEVCSGTCHNAGDGYDDYCDSSSPPPPPPPSGGSGCGAQLASIDWVSSYSNGSYQGTGDCCTGTNGDCALNAVNGVYTGYAWQCVEFAQRYLFQVYGIEASSTSAMWGPGAAADICTSGVPAGLVVYQNDGSYVPVHGDLLVLGRNVAGSYGHVTVVDSAANGVASVAEQNASPSGWNQYSLSSASCFVHATANTN